MKQFKFNKFYLVGTTTIVLCVVFSFFIVNAIPQQNITNNAPKPTQHSSVLSATTTSPIKTVFIIMLENHNWTGPSKNPTIKGSASAPYINNTLLPQSSYTNQYFNPPGIHPSEPIYLWLEAGTNFGVLDDNPPANNHQSTTKHLVTLLTKEGVTSKS